MDVGNTLNAVGEWLKNLWTKLNLDKIFGDTSSDAIQVSIYFVSFFAIGFLFKKYLKFIIVYILLTILLIKFFEYYKPPIVMLDVDREALNTLLGFEPNATFGTIASKVVEWVEGNIIISIASLTGFLFGCKLG